MRERIEQAVRQAVGDIKFVVERPADMANGDYSTNAALVGKLDAQELASKLKIEGIERIDVAGKFINFYLSYSALMKEAQNGLYKPAANNFYIGKKIMVEYTDPNPFKEFHIGHLMSNAIGESISQLFEISGGDVTRVCYQGDVGLHVAKALYVLSERDKKGELQKSNLRVQDVGTAYVEGSRRYEENEFDKSQIDDLNVKLYGFLEDRKDQSFVPTYALYELAKDECLKHFADIYRELGTDFKTFFFESETGPIGFSIVKEHSEVFEESDGARIYRGEKKGLHTRVFITSKGVPTYEAKDLGLLKLKKERGEVDKSITITAHEQTDYFAVVLAAAEEIPELHDIARKTEHISHGMMRFASGKMSSRKGNIIRGESLLEELKREALKHTAERRTENPLLLADQIAVGAIKYAILKQGSGRDIVFDPEKSLSLEGDSGPYLQYARVRALSLLRKAKAAKPVPQLPADLLLDAPEIVGLRYVYRVLIHFSDVIGRATKEMEPHYVTTFLTELAGAFNNWYGTNRIVIDGEVLQDRVLLTEAVAQALSVGLKILGIPAPEEM